MFSSIPLLRILEIIKTGKGFLSKFLHCIVVHRGKNKRNDHHEVHDWIDYGASLVWNILQPLFN